MVKNILKLNLIQMKIFLYRTLELFKMIIAVASISHESNQNYAQVFLDECLYNLQMLKYNTINMSEVIDVNKTKGFF